jgi:predicted amidohydrolase
LTDADKLTVALWQTIGCPADVAANLEALETAAAAAAAGGARLLLCPECWLSGYNIGSAVATLAESRDGISAQRIAGIARQNDLAIAYGYAERVSPDGPVYNSVQVVGADGTFRSNYRKTHLFGPAERAAYRPGDRFETPFELGGFGIGLLICYDCEFPEAVRSLALMGADLILVPTALSDEYTVVPEIIVPARAIENQVHIAYCNHAGAENGMQFLGGSRLVNCEGKSLAQAGSAAGLIFGDIEKGLPASSATNYPYRADRRPELYGRLICGPDS